MKRPAVGGLVEDRLLVVIRRRPPVGLRRLRVRLVSSLPVQRGDAKC